MKKLYALTAVLSLLGIADALYLTIEHVTGQTVRCTILSGCSEVLSSQYAVVAGFPLAAIGAAAYFAVFSLATLAVFGYTIAGKLLTPLVVAMFFVSVWLFYLQAFVIRQFCQYCLFSAAITTCLLVIVVSLRWFRPAKH
ncbi:MAG TPA: vitamin K epoxide reductase family protein [Pyrinomonadaceae bacterium]|nr:vitamin K epoxide reductase family protein [Pyrinomonadaceae bacterium]